MMRKFTFIYALLLLVCIVPAFSIWAYWPPEELIKQSDLVIEATVKLPSEITEILNDGTYNFSKDKTTYNNKFETDIIFPVTFSIKDVIKDSGILKKNQTEIDVDVLVLGTKTQRWCTVTVDYILSENETAVYFFTKTDNGVKLIHYYIYKMYKDEDGNLTEENPYNPIILPAIF